MFLNFAGKTPVITYKRLSGPPNEIVVKERLVYAEKLRQFDPRGMPETLTGKLKDGSDIGAITVVYQFRDSRVMFVRDYRMENRFDLRFRKFESYLNKLKTEIGTKKSS